MIHSGKNAYHQKKINTTSSKNTKQKIRKTAKKVPNKIPYTMKINKSIETIANGKLSNMGLFELSIYALIPTDVFHELQKRIKLIQKLLEKCQNMYTFPPVIYQVNKALNIVNSLLKNPQETRR